MQGWVSRFGLTWASGVVLVAAGITQAFSAVSEVESQRMTPRAAVVPVPLEPLKNVSPQAEQIPVKRVGGGLSVEVLDIHKGRPVEVRVSGCVDEPISLIRDGYSFPIKLYDLEEDEGCLVQARRKDGRFWTRWTQPAPVSAAGSVAVALPEALAAGVGLSIVPRPNGARIQSVVPWMPGWQAGLEVGDLLTAVDGQSLAGLGSEALVERITGPAGSWVELSLLDRRSGQAITRTVQRRPME